MELTYYIIKNGAVVKGVSPFAVKKTTLADVKFG
jgi:hypothetical protein